MAVKNAVLLGLRQAREQGQHLAVAQRRVVLQVLAQVVGGLANFALAGQKNQNVAARAALPQLVHAIGNGLVQAVILFLLERPPAHFHRVGAPGHHDHRRGLPLGIGKVPGKALGINRGRGHHHLQIGPLGQDLLQIPKQKVDVQAALVRLVNDQGVVGLQKRIGLRLGQQNAVRHQLDRRAFLQRVLKTHLKAHHLAQRRVQLLRNALGHAAGGNAPGLGVANQPPALPLRRIAHAPAQRQGDFGQLRGFARAGFATDDDDLVGLQRLGNLLAAGGYRKGFGEGDLQGS